MAQPTRRSNNVEIPPLRNLDDFLLGSARFELPDFKDIPKWNNRVIKNFLYYQTNYFVVIVLSCIGFGLAHPYKILCGLGVCGTLLYTFMKFFPDTSRRGAGDADISQNMGQDSRKWIYLVGNIAGGYFLLSMLDAILLVLLAILLPIFISFLHASMRLRNLRNKLSTSMDTLGLRNTPMGLFLEAMSITVDGILK